MKEWMKEQKFALKAPESGAVISHVARRRHRRSIFWVVGSLQAYSLGCRAVFWPGTCWKGQVPDFLTNLLRSSTSHWGVVRRYSWETEASHRNRHYVGRKELFLALRNSEKGGLSLMHLGKFHRGSDIWTGPWKGGGFRQLEDILGRRNGFMGNCGTGELPRIAGLSQFGGR